MAKSSTIGALEFLSHAERHTVSAVCAVYGDEMYLKREVLTALRRQVLGDAEGEFALTTLAGPATQLCDVLDALATVSLFGSGRRLVIAEDADSFVTQYRTELEDYVAKPAKGAVLVLEVTTWPSTTRLAKAVAATGLTIECKSPNERQTKSWLTERAKSVHNVRLDASAADALLELLPPELGLLAQELDKLAIIAGDKRVVDATLVRENVGGWRTRAVWDLVDAAAEGRAVEALEQLDRLVSSGEKPHGILPQMASSLRKFDAATRLIEAAEADRRKLPLRDALAQAGVIHFKLSDAERQLRRIGRRRAQAHRLAASCRSGDQGPQFRRRPGPDRAGAHYRKAGSGEQRAKCTDQCLIESFCYRLSALCPPLSALHLASSGSLFYHSALPCQHRIPNQSMLSPLHRLASLLTVCAVALAATGCHTPWSITDKDINRYDAPPTTVTPTPPTVTSPPAATDADMAGVIEKLQQVGELDLAAQATLMAHLQRTEPRFWPAVAEQFRASLAYHQELVASKRLADHDANIESDFDSLPLHTTAESRPIPVPPYTTPAPPSTPLGSLGDPRNADADGVSSEALARVAPSAQRPPLSSLDGVPSPINADAPPNFEAAGPALPIASQRSVPASADSIPSSAVIPAAFNAPANSTSISSQSQTDDDRAKNWQQLVVEAADDLSRRVADSPATTAEVHQHVSLRILRLLAGETEAALEPIPHIAPAEQDYWSRQLFALATQLDHHSQPDDKRRAAAAATHLDEAVAHLRELGALSLRNFAFCTNIYGYGAIEPYKEDRFAPGQQVTLYVEVENYHSQSTEKGFTTSLGSTYEILDEKHERVDGGEFPNVDDCCRSRRRDFHIQFGLTMPEKIAPGQYQLELVVRDRQSDKIAHATAQFEIRGTSLATPPRSQSNSK